MVSSSLTRLIMAAVVIAALATTTFAKDFDPQYIGGYPTKETAEAMFEEYDYQAAVQFYVWGYSYLNNLGMHKALVELGGDERSFYLFDKRVGPQHQIMTANAIVTYAWPRIIDLSKGPVVLEVPAGVRGHLYDMATRAFSDVGDVGPDKGKGGKYLIVNANFDGVVPEGHFLVRNHISNTITLGVRAFPAAAGSVEKSVEVLKSFKWYYLSEAGNPPTTTYVSIGTKAFSQEWPRDERAFEWLAEAFTMDKVPASGMAHMGNMRRLGIEAGKPFNPDKRAKRILKRAAKTAEAMVLSMAYSDRITEKVYDNRRYGPIFFTDSPTFYSEDTEHTEARAGQNHLLIGNVANQIPPTPGIGGFYTTTFTDADGNFLMGDHTYRLHVPANVPVKQFWQIPVYSAKTRSMINNEQGKFAIGGTNDLKLEADGSVILYFGPQAPQGYEQNWIQTNPGEGWFTLPRLFAPLESVLDRTWRWNDIEKIK
jgi:hypothetical protein